jgi:hypothetical protein
VQVLHRSGRTSYTVKLMPAVAVTADLNPGIPIFPFHAILDGSRECRLFRLPVGQVFQASIPGPGLASLHSLCQRMCFGPDGRPQALTALRGAVSSPTVLHLLLPALRC